MYHTSELFIFLENRSGPLCIGYIIKTKSDWSFQNKKHLLQWTDASSFMYHRGRLASGYFRGKIFHSRQSKVDLWIQEFSDQQMTLFMTAIFPQLGASQLHSISSQLPEHNPG